MRRTAHLRTLLIENAGFHALGFMIVYALKSHYSRATSDQLAWILTPTALLVDTFSGIHFDRELHAGAISREHGIILAPACAGVNFLIIAFSTLWFSLVHRVKNSKGKLVWLGMSASASYLLSLGVNALRVIVSVFLYRADIYGGWATPERVHRIGGVLIYVFFLLLVYRIGEKAVRWVGAHRSKEGSPRVAESLGLPPLVCGLAVPLLWYVSVTVVTPLLNQAWRHQGAKFVEHSVLVVAAGLIVLLLFTLLVLGSRGIEATIRWVCRNRPASSIIGAGRAGRVGTGGRRWGPGGDDAAAPSPGTMDRSGRTCGEAEDFDRRGRARHCGQHPVRP
jgi:exosortase K